MALSQGEVSGAARGKVPSTTRSPTNAYQRDEGGTTLLDLAELAGFPRATIVRAEVPRLSAPGVVEVAQDELRNGFGGDPLGHREATVDAGVENSVRFFRPLRDDDDFNAQDAVTAAGENDLEVRLYTDNTEQREVSASADDETPRANVATGFLAEIEDRPAGAQFTYRWDFDDGTTATGQSPSHAFRAGTYNVTVTVVGSDGSAGVSAPLRIQSGDAVGVTPTPSPSPGASPTPPPQNPGGDEGPGGLGPGGEADSGGSDNDPEDGASGPKDDPKGPGGGTQSKPTPTSTSTATPRDPTATPTLFASATPTPSASATPAATPPLRDDDGPGDADEEDEQRKAPSKPSPQSEIDGVLLAGAGDVAQLERILESVPPQTASPVRSGGGGGSPPPLGWVGGGVGFFLLLGAGALRERRGAWM